MCAYAGPRVTAQQIPPKASEGESAGCVLWAVQSSSALWLEGTCSLSLPSSRFSESLGDSE